MIVQRRVFEAKVGQAPAVVAKVKEFIGLMEGKWPGQNRIYTDHLSGKTDRVAWEAEIASLGEMENLHQTYGEDAQLQSWFESLMPLLEGATVEHWSLE